MSGNSTDLSLCVQSDNRVPICRTPITQEVLADSIAKSETTGIPIEHPAGKHFGNALYESVSRMVGMISTRFGETCHEPSEDLVQECFKRVFFKINKFDKDKAKFTTWCWYVCMNTLRHRYNHIAKRRDINNFEDPDIIARMSPAELRSAGYESVLRDEIIDGLEVLAKRHPRNRRLIFEMFGNPVKGQDSLSSRPLFVEAAKSVGVTQQWAYSFYCSKVRPYFQRKFMEDYR